MDNSLPGVIEFPFSVVLSIVLLVVAPYKLLAVWATLLLLNLPPLSRTILYTAVVIGIMQANYRGIPKWNEAAMAERTALPPLGLARQVINN